MGGCCRWGKGGRLNSEGQSDQREGVYRSGGGARPLGLCPWGSRTAFQGEVSTVRAGTAVLARSVSQGQQAMPCRETS